VIRAPVAHRSSTPSACRRAGAERGAGPALAACVLGAWLASGCEPDRTPAPGAAAGMFPPHLPARVDSIARAARAAGPIAGLSIAIAHDGAPVFAGTWGVADVSSGAEVDRSTVYEIGSVTTLFTGAGAMLLADEGELDLDAPVASLLPALADVPHAASIRVRHLLTHTSGVRDFEPEAVDAWVEDGSPVTTALVLEAAREPLRFAPGTSWAYSNTGFRLVGEIVARLTGRPYGAFLEERIVAPLGLEHTSLCDERPEDPLRARIHDVGPDGFEVSRLDHQPGYTSAGGICTTIEDLVRLPGALTRSGLLSDSALARMLSPTVLVGGPTIDYGLGVRLGVIDRHATWGGMGGVGTYWAVLIHVPDDEITVAVLQNTDGAGEDALTIAGAVVRAALGLGPPTLRPAGVEHLGRFAGRYDDEGGGFAIALVGDSLIRSRGSKHALVPLGPLEFGWGLFPMDRFRFHELDGEIVGVSDYYNGLFAGFFPRLGGLETVPDPGTGGESAG